MDGLFAATNYVDVFMKSRIDFMSFVNTTFEMRSDIKEQLLDIFQQLEKLRADDTLDNKKVSALTQKLYDII